MASTKQNLRSWAREHYGEQIVDPIAIIFGATGSHVATRPTYSGLRALRPSNPEAVKSVHQLAEAADTNPEALTRRQRFDLVAEAIETEGARVILTCQGEEEAINLSKDLIEAELVTTVSILPIDELIPLFLFDEEGGV